MKILYLFFVLLYGIPTLGHTNPLDEFDAIIIEDMPLQENEEGIKAQLFDPKKKKDHKQEINLIGQVRAVSSPITKDTKIVQVIWTGVRGKDKKKVSFKEPLISTFKSDKSILSKGSKISLSGNKDQIYDAILRLEKGEDEFVGELKVDNPTSNERRLQDLEGNFKRRNASKSDSILGDQTLENQSHDNLSHSSLSDSFRSHSLVSEGEGKKADALIRKSSNHQSQHHLGRNGNLSARKGFSASKSKGYPNGSPLNMSSQMTSPGAQEVHQSKDPNNNSLSGREDKSLPSSNMRGMSSSLNKQDNNDFIVRPSGEFDPSKIKQKNPSEGDDFEMPLIEVEVTKEGCKPRIDLERGKVILQTRSIARTNGTITHETQCADSHLIFDLKKDYSCCSDSINQQARVAYTTFKRYWIDENNNKIYVDDVCLKDESHPHPFIEEKKLCPYDIDLSVHLAYNQTETIYYDRSNARKLVTPCHRNNDMPFPIIFTSQGCSLKHVFHENKSILQKRAIFIDQGVSHEVLPCHETKEFFPHQFVKAKCKPSIAGGHVTRMVKRQIINEGQKKIITDQCEPEIMTELLSTNEGCERLYTHDLEAGVSYPHVKYYYLKGPKRHYLEGGCQRSNEGLLHQIKVVGYEHRDDLLKSKPRYQICIPDKNKDLIIQERTETNELSWIPYILSQEVERPSLTQSSYLQNNTLIIPRNKVQIWSRADGSVFEKEKEPIASITQELSQTTAPPSQITAIQSSTTVINTPKPQRTVVQVTHEYATRAYTYKDRGRTYEGSQPSIRDITHYSDGTKTYSDWRKN